MIGAVEDVMIGQFIREETTYLYCFPGPFPGSLEALPPDLLRHGPHHIEPWIPPCIGIGRGQLDACHIDCVEPVGIEGL